MTGKLVQTSGGSGVRLKLLEVGQGHSVMEIGIDYSKVDPPERSYYADYSLLEKGRFGYSLTFGKFMPGTTRLRTKIEISFPAEMFVKQLWGTSRDFHKTVEELVQKMGFSPSPVTLEEDTDKVQTFRSNNVFMGVWGEEAVIDFYYMSPRDIYYIRTKKATDVELQPVVRVAMPTQLIYEFLEQCRPFVESSPELEILTSEEGEAR
jgi:hypothetical protein